MTKVGSEQCEMVHSHHPDCECESCTRMEDPPCGKPFVGTVPDDGGTRVCGACAVDMERAGFIVSYRDETRFVLAHPEMGVYLGSCLGMGFWSKPDPVGQPAAVTFANRAQADEVMRSWDCGRPDKVVIWPVVPDKKSTDGYGDLGVVYASVAACVAAGLDAWDPEAKPAT